MSLKLTLTKSQNIEIKWILPIKRGNDFCPTIWFYFYLNLNLNLKIITCFTYFMWEKLLSMMAITPVEPSLTNLIVSDCIKKYERIIFDLIPTISRFFIIFVRISGYLSTINKYFQLASLTSINKRALNDEANFWKISKLNNYS